MNKKISLATAIILILFSVILTFQITYHVVEVLYQEKVDVMTRTASDLSLLDEADRLIRSSSAKTVDDSAVNRAMIEGYIKSLDDPAARYLTPDEYNDYQNEHVDIGPGIGVRLTYDEKHDRIIIYHVFPSSPAEEQGIAKGDVFVSVNGKPASEIGFFAVASALSADAGDDVQLTVEREIAARTLQLDFTLTSREITVPTIGFEMLSDHVGFIQFFSIDERTKEEVAKALDRFASLKAESLLLDVRDCKEGNSTALAAVLDLLLPAGELFSVTDPAGTETVLRASSDGADLPMAVLINGETCGIGEMFAAVLRDNAGAFLVGEKTAGRAYEQDLITLSDGSAILLSVNALSPLFSESFDKTGLEPDETVLLNSTNRYLLTVDEDKQIQSALHLLLD